MKLKVGSKVKIKLWDDMVEEFGYDKNGNIKLSNYVFRYEMKGLCGKEIEVSMLDPFNSNEFYSNNVFGCTFTMEMVEKIIEGENDMKFKKEDLNGLMLFKLRRQGLCALLPNEVNGNTLHNKEYLQSGISGGLIPTFYYDSDLKYSHDSYDIIAIKKFDSGNKIISLILNDNEPDEWDWVREEKTEQEIKLENVISGLQEQLEKAKYELSNIKKGI